MVSLPNVNRPVTAPGCAGANVKVNCVFPPGWMVIGSAAGRLLRENPAPLTLIRETCPAPNPVLETVTVRLVDWPTLVAGIATVPPAKTCLLYTSRCV